MRDRREQIVLVPAEVGQLAVQAGVGDGERGHPRQRLGEGDVAGLEAPARVGGDEGEGAERASVGEQGHGDVRGHTELGDEPLALGVAGRDQHGGVGDVDGNLALARAHHAGDATAVRVGRPRAQQRADVAAPARLRVDDGQTPVRRLALEHVDGAPVGEARYRQLGDASQGDLRVGRPRDRAGDVGEQVLPLGVVEGPIGDHEKTPAPSRGKSS